MRGSWAELSPGQAICHFYSEPRFRANPVLPPVISYRLCFKMFTWNARRGRRGCEVGVRKGAEGGGGGVRKEKKGKSFLSFSASFPS